MTTDEKRKLYAALSAPFPPEAVERTDGKTTGRGFSTTGIKYQYVVNRVNEVLGVGSFRAHRTITVKEITRSNGRPAYEALCDLTIEIGSWENGQWIQIGEALADGGHVSSSEADARKGCFTNALKKGFAMFGVGRQAYEGSIDDDNVPSEDAPHPFAPVQVPQPKPAPVQQKPTDPSPTPLGYVRTGPAVDTSVQQQAERSRLSSKQLAAIHSIARKIGIEPAALRARVKAQYGVQTEWLTKSQASETIKTLDAQLRGNGHDAEMAS